MEPAVVLENGKFKYKKPLKTIRIASHKTIGKQKEFMVRHPETYTLYHYFKDKGLKNVRFYAGFPLHSFDRIMAIIELGMGNLIEIDFNGGAKIKPIDFLTEVLKDLETPEGYKEKENIWVRIEGTRGRRKKKILMECLAPTLEGWESAGCNIDTGFPASIIAQMIKKGVIHRRGSFAPEAIVPPRPFFAELGKKGMTVLENGIIINHVKTE
jgi:saccharopine dehydrogenase-like NADP-dependent oxidoreductase